MTRKLLPYEYELIQTLGVSEEEYRDFLSVQHDYSRSPEEKLQELRNGPVAIVLAVVGILFQVASVFLMPKPEIPKMSAGNRNRRDQQFSPRFGFNTSQDLAKYGDAINLVYCNTDDNAAGGVRVATSLIWSAVQSYGSSQFMQMMLAVGAGTIQEISVSRTAFGQTPVKQFVTQKTWTYFNNGLLRFDNLLSGDNSDPTRVGLASSALVYQTTLVGNQRTEGFSQSFSPTTMNKCGVYAAIPINVQFVDRDDKGKIRKAALGITVSGLEAYWPSFSASKARVPVPVGHRFTMSFARMENVVKSDTIQAAQELRRTLFSNIDAASVYKLGSAKYRVAAFNSTDIENADVAVTFECIESGLCPQEDYGTQDYIDNQKEATDAIVSLQARNAELNALLSQNGGAGPPIFYSDPSPRVLQLEGQINALNDGIEDLRAYRESRIQLRDIEESAYNDPMVNQIIREIDALQNQVEQIRSGNKQTTSNKPVPGRPAPRLPAKSTTSLEQQIKRKEAQLLRAIVQYGLQNGTERGGKNIVDLIKRQKQQLVNLQRQMAQLTPSSALWNRPAMDARNAGWRAEVAANDAAIADYQQDINDPEELNDYFQTKCLVKAEEASYTTITQSRVVDFALKARVFQRVQGRATRYGEVKAQTFKDSDNGVKIRSMFFWLWYRRTSDPQWTRSPRIFVVRRGADVDNFIFLKFIGAANTGGWEFRFDPIAETAAEMRHHGLADFAFIENTGPVQTIAHGDGTSVAFLGTLGGRADIYQSPLNRGPSQLDEWALFSVRSDTQLQFSFDQGPELSVMAVTEQRIEPLSAYPNLYQGLSLLGFNAYSGQGIQDLRSVSVFVTKGKMLRRLRDDGTYPANPDGSSSYAPDIFLDTILDGTNGIGRFAKVEGIDLQALALAKRFCRANGFFMDGVLAEQTPWRQFWAESAPFSLLELGRIGGKEALIPAVPCNSAGQITQAITISAMFNQGNILEDSYKEEFLDFGTSVQDLIASVMYRDTERNEAFPRNSSVEVQRADTTEANAVRQTFDLSQFVTSRNQAIAFAKLLCNQRRHIRKAIEFSTFPTDSVISPGAYIYVAIGENQWDQITTGAIEAGGSLNTPISGVADGSGYNALVYQSGAPVVSLSGITVSGNSSAELAPYAGRLFVLGKSVTRKRVFRVTEVEMDEEGEVRVKAVEHPCVQSGAQTLSLIADFSDSLFTVR